MRAANTRPLVMALLPLLLLTLLPELASPRITGFHTDIESCDGDVDDGQNRTRELALCNAFFGTLANISATLKAASALLPAGAAPFILAVDSGTSWSCPEDDGSTACYKVPWAGKNQSVARHVVDIADQVSRQRTPVYSTRVCIGRGRERQRALNPQWTVRVPHCLSLGCSRESGFTSPPRLKSMLPCAPPPLF